MTPAALASLLAHRDRDRLEAALATLDPADPAALALRAELLRRVRRHAEAASLFDAAVAAAPDVVPLVHAAALCDVALGRHASACARWEALLDRAPGVAAAWFNLGLARAALGRTDEAIAALDRAAAIAEDDARPLARAAALLGERAALPEAIERLTRAIAIEPTQASLRFARAAHRSSLALHAEATGDLRAAVALAPGDAAGASALLLELHYDAALATPDELSAAHRDWARRHATAAPLPATPRTPRARLRVGYLSPRFGDPPLTALLTPVLEAHDRKRIEAVAFSAWPVTGPDAERVRRAVDRWVELPNDDDEAAAAIAAADVDLLVDLAGHAPGNRLPVLARRPARVQATWLDWFDTTGVPAIDWLIGDAVQTPAQERDRFTERLVLLPHARFAYRPPVAVAPAEAPSVRRGYVTFASFNRHAKHTDDVIATWARILRALPHARLRLQAAAYGASSTVAFVRERWARAGVPVERIDFVPRVDLPALHRAYDEVDIALDPFPFTGGVTTCDALAHGVPVVTLAGDRMVARQGAALLHAVGRSGWVAPDRDAYVRVAVALAAPGTVARERAALARDFARSPLADVAGFARTLEHAYAAMVGAGTTSREPIAIEAV